MSTDPSAAARTPEELRWEPLSPEEVAGLLLGFTAPWWIAGGWALDLFIGRQTRAHNDIEIAIFRGDASALRAFLTGWEFFIAEDGTLRPLAPGTALAADAHELWSRERGRSAWQLEVLIEDREGERWAYRRHPRIGANVHDLGRVTESGIPYLRPEIQLLYKSQGSRAVDESDLITILPRLDPAQRATLVAWLFTMSPTHRWLERLK